MKIGVIFGGQSPEHTISIRSAKTVIKELANIGHDPVPIGVSLRGTWHLFSMEKFWEIFTNLQSSFVEYSSETRISAQSLTHFFDVAFPIIHGPNGEDGTLQGFLQTLNLPYVGCGVLGSSVSMDKVVAKKLLNASGLPVAGFIAMRQTDTFTFEDLCQILGKPFFLKPANLGSSIGIHKVLDSHGYQLAVEEAFSYDTKVIVEECIYGRELECSVLGAEDPIASLPGEVVPQGGFYDYHRKYLDKDGAKFHLPANLPFTLIAEVQKLAIEAFKVLCCNAMARVDFFLKNDGSLLINEVNTVPGFTENSLYPKLWELSGISIGRLMQKLIDLAIDNHRVRSNFSAISKVTCQ